MATTMQLRDYQQRAITRLEEHVRQAMLNADAPRRLLLTAPTGSGKSLVMREARSHLLKLGDGVWDDVRIIVTGPEVARGFIDGSYTSDEKLMSACWEEGVTTAERLVNRILSGHARASSVYFIDEGHHSTSMTYQTLSVLSRPETIWIAFTATGYRGTPRGTLALHELWGKPEPMLTLSESLERGYSSLPSFRTVPLVDDDLITIGDDGDFVVERVEQAVRSRLADVARIVAESSQSNGRLDRPTMVACPSRKIAREIADEIEQHGIRAVVVDGDTDRSYRDAAYAECQTLRSVLVQIAVVGEGVDLPWMRRLIDARPTMSPVAWYQLVGRITRPVPPGEDPPEYIGLCRNLGRHATLFEGYTPVGAIIAETAAFGGVSTRSTARHLGLEGASRFKRLELRLANGLRGDVVYIENYTPGVGSEQYCVISAPHRPEPVIGKRVNTPGQWGRWVAAKLPVDLMGFSTSGMRGAASDKQRAAWGRMAQRYGLDPVLPNNAKMRDITPLFALKDLGVRL